MPTGLENARSLYVEAIERGDYARAIETYAGDRYVQHSHPVPDGKDGFKEFFAAFVEREPDRRMDIVRSFQDGRYVFLHVVQVLGGAPTWVTMDVFDTDDDGRLVEHWDIISAWRADTASGRGMTDGPRLPADGAPTDANKELVRRFVEQVLVGGDHAARATFLADDLVEHSPDLTDGARGFRRLDEGRSRYHRLHLLVGQGDLVATLSHAELDGTDSAVMDLFRVAGGRVVEHWDTIEEIVPRDQWVNGGKF